MSDYKSAIRNLVASEFQKAQLTSNSANRLGTVQAVNADGSVTVSVAGTTVTANPVYPCVMGQQVIVIANGGVFRAAPTGPAAPPVEIIHPPFFSGGKQNIRIAGTAPQTIPENTNGGFGIYIQQQGDSNIYFINFGVPPFSDIPLINVHPMSFSPNGRYLGCGFIAMDNHTFATTSRVCCIDLGTAKFVGTDANVLDPVLMVFDITDKVKVTSVGQWFPDVFHAAVFNGEASGLVVGGDDGGMFSMVNWVSNDSNLFGYSILKFVPGDLNQSVTSLHEVFYFLGGESGLHLGPALGPTGEIGNYMWDPQAGLTVGLNSTYQEATFNLLFFWNSIFQMPSQTQFNQLLIPLTTAPFANLLPAVTTMTSDFKTAFFINQDVDSNVTVTVFYQPPGGVIVTATLLDFNFNLWNADGRTGGGPILLFTKKDKFLLMFDEGDRKPLVFTLKVDGLTLVPSDDPVNGFSPDQPDDSVVRLLDVFDIGCTVYAWASPAVS